MLLCILDIDRLKKKKKKKLNTFLRTRTKIPFKYPFSSNYNFYFTRKKSELYSYALVKTPGRLFAKPFPYSMCSL